MASTNNIFKAYALTEKGGNWEPFEFDAGELKPDEVQIKVISCGLCHSDLSMANNDWGMTQYPFVGGHEAYGIIERVGADVKSLKVGQRAGVGAASGFCGDCRWCRQGHDNVCESGQITIIGRHGGFASHIRAQARAVAPVPDGIEGDYVGPLFCGGNTVFKPIMENVKPTHKVGVIGIGGLGSMAVQFLKAWGSHVTAFTSSEAKRKSALELGAHETISSVNEDELKAAAGRFDVIISTVNVKLNWNLVVGTLTKCGHLYLCGAVLEPLDISALGLLFGDKVVSAGPVGSSHQLRTMLDFADRHQIKPQVKVFNFTEINAAFDELRTQPQGRIVLKW